MSPYTYKPLERLDEIRLISILPPRHGTEEEIEVIIQHTLLSDDPLYEALSYVWGSDEKTHQLTASEGAVPITKSLYFALKRIRSLWCNDRVVTIWADAVCINQMDDKEKGQQIPLMGQIYGNAKAVLVYLGEESGDSDTAMDLAQQLAQADLDNPSLPQFLQDTDMINIGFPANESSDWKALRVLQRRPWFTRAWIVQEFALGKTVLMICGVKVINADAFVSAITRGAVRAIICMQTAVGEDPIDVAATQKGKISILMLASARARHLSGSSWPLLGLLELLRSYQATNPYDHMFAALGLASATDDAFFVPDYTEPLDSLLNRYAKRFITEGFGMDMLYIAGTERSSGNYPSWIPDWTTEAEIHVPLGGGLANPAIQDERGQRQSVCQYSAATQKQADMSFHRNPNVLSVRGAQFDKVIWVGFRYSEHPDSGANRTLLGSLNPMIDRIRELTELLLPPTQYPTGETWSQVAWKVLVANSDSQQQEAPPEFGIMFLEFLRFITQDNPFASPQEDISQLYHRVQPFLHATIRLFEAFKLCATEKGFMGLVPNTTQVGDRIAIFYGATVPFVLRNSGENDSNSDACWKLVGECYIHGIMNGESLLLEDLVEECILLD